MRLLLICLLACATPFAAAAQSINFDSIITPLDTVADTFQEYLIQLAWMNSPENQGIQKEEQIARLSEKNTRKEWLRDIGMAINVNEANINDPILGGGSNFFPRWNIGIGISPYNIITQPTKNKIARKETELAKLAVQDRMLAVRRETLMAYEAFKAAKEAHSFRAVFEQDAHSNFLLTKELYQKDEVNFQDYSAASTAYFQAQELRQKSEIDMRLSQYALEELIGVRWENVTHPGKDIQ